MKSINFLVNLENICCMADVVFFYYTFDSKVISPLQGFYLEHTKKKLKKNSQSLKMNKNHTHVVFCKHEWMTSLICQSKYQEGEIIVNCFHRFSILLNIEGVSVSYGSEGKLGLFSNPPPCKPLLLSFLSFFRNCYLTVRLLCRVTSSTNWIFLSV